MRGTKTDRVNTDSFYCDIKANIIGVIVLRQTVAVTVFIFVPSSHLLYKQECCVLQAFCRQVQMKPMHLQCQNRAA